ncbi:hypothetical protein PLEI_3744 [Photobacterium leiognathi lrivu.4.1]|uniref:Uncharacterized protein n=1 Tax=Photobacterium leiognathi lrivu.4.1 TaxID=1248232 RepID=V5EQP0_PHOLE|nr:hypothetical protein PLEI_3744 [Photobacterium leiognathi lrivu.4.1]
MYSKFTPALNAWAISSFFFKLQPNPMDSEKIIGDIFCVA